MAASARASDDRPKSSRFGGVDRARYPVRHVWRRTGRAGVNYVKWGAAVALLVAAFFAGHHVAAQAGQINLAAVTQANAKAAQHVAELATKASEAARAAEHKQADAFNAISLKYEQDKSDAQADADRTIADLRAGNLRLRASWRCPAAGVQGAATSAGEHQATNRLQEESAGRILRDVAELQAQRDAALDLLEAERQP